MRRRAQPARRRTSQPAPDCCPCPLPLVSAIRPGSFSKNDQIWPPCRTGQRLPTRRSAPQLAIEFAPWRGRAADGPKLAALATPAWLPLVGSRFDTRPRLVPPKLVVDAPLRDQFSLGSALSTAAGVCSALAKRRHPDRCGATASLPRGTLRATKCERPAGVPASGWYAEGRCAESTAAGRTCCYQPPASTVEHCDAGAAVAVSAPGRGVRPRARMGR